MVVAGSRHIGRAVGGIVVGMRRIERGLGLWVVVLLVLTRRRFLLV